MVYLKARRHSLKGNNLAAGFFGGTLLLLTSSACQQTEIRTYESSKNGRTNIGLLVDSSKHGIFITREKDRISKVAFFDRDQLKSVWVLFEGNITIQEDFHSERLKSKSIVDYDYYLKSRKLYFDPLQNTYDAGKSAFHFNCEPCHYKLREGSFFELSKDTSVLRSRLEKLLESYQAQDRFNLIWQEVDSHSVFTHLDQAMMRNIYSYLRNVSSQ